MMLVLRFQYLHENMTSLCAQHSVTIFMIAYGSHFTINPEAKKNNRFGSSHMVVGLR